MVEHVDLSTFSAAGFDKRAPRWRRVMWYAVSVLVVQPSWNVSSAFKVWLLRLFGAQIGRGMIIKNNVVVKSPWNLTAGDNVWLGERCWIDNLDCVTLGDNVCISQGAMLLTGNHDYTRPDFAYRNGPIVVADGAWIGARSVVCPGVTVGSHAVLTVGSVATRDLEPYSINQGNPAIAVRRRVLAN